MGISTDDKARNILEKLPNECPSIDYKEKPYKLDEPHSKVSLIKDVIAMLNTVETMHDDKFIIVGVTDNGHELKGIEKNAWRDDNEWQNLLDNGITPSPHCTTGTVKFEEKLFGYIYISSTNNDWVYKSKKTITSEKKTLLEEGQAFTRRGSCNRHLPETDSDYRKLEEEQLKEEFLIRQLGLIGSWNEQYDGDVEVVKKITGLSKDELFKRIERYRLESQSALSDSDGVWTINDQYKVVVEGADKIYDNHLLQLFFDCLEDAFEIDPKYSLNPDKMSSQQGLKYSKAIKEGMAKTLAILGNNEERFTNITKIQNTVDEFIQNFFKADDWRVYASQGTGFQYVGEASPRTFLDEIEDHVAKEDNAFVEFLNKGEITYCLYAISNIARLEQYFSQVIGILFRLAKSHTSFEHALIEVMCDPKISASIPKRVNLFKQLASDDINLTWKLLMKLMPDSSTVRIPLPQNTTYLKVDDDPEIVSKKDLNKEFLLIAIDISGNEVKRLCDLLKVIEHVDIKLQNKITDRISNASIKLSQEDKEYLWNKIQDFLERHRNFPCANRTLGEERLRFIDKLASNVLPDSAHAYAVRLFSNCALRNCVLEEKQEELKNEQTNILKEIYRKNGIKRIVAFEKEVENTITIGSCLSSFIDDADVSHFISKSEQIENDDLIKGVFLTIDIERTIKIICNEPGEIQAKILSFLPLTKQVLMNVEELDSNAQEIFWNLTQALGSGQDYCEIYERVVERLNTFKHTDKSISILYECLLEKRKIKVSVVVDTLFSNVEAASAQQRYEIQYLIKWLQKQYIDKEQYKETVILLELKYLGFLQGSDCSPKFLWNKMSSDPKFYMKIIMLVFGKEDYFSGSNEEKDIIWNFIWLLDYWEKVPGLRINGTLDAKVLDKWIEVVAKESKKYGVEEYAFRRIGHVAFYAPKDKDGFFIDEHVANILEGNKNALDGYCCELRKSLCAQCVDETGQTEFKHEKECRDKATAADEKGKYRLASRLRCMADKYHSWGEYNTKNKGIDWVKNLPKRKQNIFSKPY